jgi:anti-anti-sigma factor
VVGDNYPVEWTGRVAVVTLPQHVDAANAGQIREELLLVISQGAAALIADMTATASCDHAGADAVVRVYQRATASGVPFRLVVTTQAVRRMLSVNGVDRLVPVYPSLAAAVAAQAPVPPPP